jgi:glycosyltransferase involved in cell wall biosynthesis
LPAYNCEKYIEVAINSVVNQTYRNLEIVVVDDCSTDKTWEIIQKMADNDSRIKPLRNKENSKIVKTLNNAIENSSGKYLARMDGDDERVLDSIEKQVNFLENNKDVAVVGGSSEICDENMTTINKREYLLTDSEIRKKLFRFSPFTHATIVMRASMVPTSPYRLDWAEDYDLYFRLANNGKLANLPDVLYRIRTHKKSVSRTKTRYQEKLTLYIRLKAVFEYGYKMSKSDKLYFFAQLVTMYMMPSNFRFWFFNKIRGFLK